MTTRMNHRRGYTYDCPECKQPFHPRRIGQVSCSIACAARRKSRTGEYGIAGAIGGRKGGATRRRQVLDRWREKFPGVPPEAVREIYQRGYQSGYVLGDQRGYRRGYADACGEEIRGVA